MLSMCGEIYSKADSEVYCVASVMRLEQNMTINTFPVLNMASISFINLLLALP